MGYRMFSNGDWKIQDVCKTCMYRKPFYYRRTERSENSDWSDTYCSYLETTGELRGCEPSGNECKRYKYTEEKI